MKTCTPEQIINNALICSLCLFTAIDIVGVNGLLSIQQKGEVEQNASLLYEVPC
jgi:hypothetical protein